MRKNMTSRKSRASPKAGRSNTPVSERKIRTERNSEQVIPSKPQQSVLSASGNIVFTTFNLIFGAAFRLFLGVLSVLAPYLVVAGVFLILLSFIYIKAQSALSFTFPFCHDGQVGNPVTMVLCGRGISEIPIPEFWCKSGGDYITPSTCRKEAESKKLEREKKIVLITKATIGTLDQGKQLMTRTQQLPDPRSLAVRSANIHNLQWAVAAQTNLTNKEELADGLKSVSEKLDHTTESLIELRGDAEYALVDMVTQFERIESALEATLTGTKEVVELEELFDQVLQSTDDMLKRLQVTAVDAAERTKKTRNSVDRVLKLLADQKRTWTIDHEAQGVWGGLFSLSKLSRTQSRQLKEDVDVWNAIDSKTIGLSEDLAIIGIELKEFRHNVKLYRSSWSRAAWVSGDIKDQVAALRLGVRHLRAQLNGPTTGSEAAKEISM
ncbi:hypothetical protein DFS34DRAFT_634329 [Phlyctochytrium arcticum]|nr:hypothetical protein DFS34DRAFT_634329 [Phlyctochytrium arcticum]